MRKIISISEALKPGSDGSSHLQAGAEALYDDEAGELEVRLELTGPGQNKIPRDKSERLESQTVRIKVDLDEADSAARDIFHSWIRRLLGKGRVLIEN